ncbi:MAG: glycosyltransferase [Planctomycetaceae bacterium]|jgi:glycosyltransferase involved in cell wall biosynthesis
MSEACGEAAAVPPTIRVSVVVPVYRGESTLETLLAEIEPLAVEQVTPAGHRAVICEVLLVHDCGPDRSDQVIESLAARHDWVRPVWLSHNFGQHAATLAGMAGALGDWVVTLDEDRQHNPADIAALLDLALAEGLQLVYAQPRNPPPHGWLRNTASRLAKTLANALIGVGNTGHFHSFRLVTGEVARSLAAYCGSGVYLDVALRWIVARVGFCPVTLRGEMVRPSGYSLRRLLSHFSFLVMTAGARPLRLIALLGLVSIGLAIAIALWALYAKLTGRVTVAGWTSLVIVITFFSGCILLALGVIAEYLALTMSIAMGKPLYVVTTTPTRQREHP